MHVIDIYKKIVSKNVQFSDEEIIYKMKNRRLADCFEQR
jgi:hypothetical protein